MSLDPEFLEVLVCPKCKGGLKETEQGLACEPCELVYPVKEGIPRMLPEEAAPLKRDAAPAAGSAD